MPDDVGGGRPRYAGSDRREVEVREVSVENRRPGIVSNDDRTALAAARRGRMGRKWTRTSSRRSSSTESNSAASSGNTASAAQPRCATARSTPRSTGTNEPGRGTSWAASWTTRTPRSPQVASAESLGTPRAALAHAPYDRIVRLCRGGRRTRGGRPDSRRSCDATTADSRPACLQRLRLRRDGTRFDPRPDVRRLSARRLGQRLDGHDARDLSGLRRAGFPDPVCAPRPQPGRCLELQRRHLHLPRAPTSSGPPRTTSFEPTFIERCLEALEAGPPTVALCYPTTVVIDAEGSPLRVQNDALDARSSRPHERFYQVLMNVVYGNPTFGVMRRELLGQTRLHGSFPSADWCLPRRKARRSRARSRELPDRLFRRREHPGMSRVASENLAALVHWLDPSAPVIRSEHWKLLQEFIAGIQHARLSRADRVLTYGAFAAAWAHRHSWLSRRSRGPRPKAVATRGLGRVPDQGYVEAAYATGSYRCARSLRTARTMGRIEGVLWNSTASTRGRRRPARSESTTSYSAPSMSSFSRSTRS